MRKPRDRQAENARYMAKKREQGFIVTTFLVPRDIRHEVQQFIKTRSQELMSKG